jgi:hypothetical protein
MPSDLSVLGGFSVKFRYTKDWLQSAYGFDPINLPLSLCYAEFSATTRGRSLTQRHAVVCDDGFGLVREASRLRGRGEFHEHIDDKRPAFGVRVPVVHWSLIAHVGQPVVHIR